MFPPDPLFLINSRDHDQVWGSDILTRLEGKYEPKARMKSLLGLKEGLWNFQVQSAVAKL